MSIPKDQNLLPRPPRLNPDGSGYDWREFDRYLQKIYTMLQLTYGSKFYNIPEAIRDLQAQSLVEGMTISNASSPTEDDLLKELLSIRAENPTFENRISSLEDELEEMMEQLDTVINRLDSLLECSDRFHDILVELRVVSGVLNEGLNTKEDLDILRQDEESDL